jgi:two-component system, LytTR family, sensor kinase
MKFSKKTALLIAVFAFFIQLIIIIYNHLTGFIDIKNAAEFIQRIIIGTTFSALFGGIAVYINLKIINVLDDYLPWIRSAAARMITELIAAVMAGVLVGTAITVTAHIPFPYDDLLFHIVNNSLITIIINVIVIIALEALQYFRRHQTALIKTEKLQKENAQIKLQLLKNQLNPHFLFNSLNVLSALIRKDSVKSQEFIDEFSSVYRYILEVIEKPVVELRDEINFAKSYLYLQQIRFEDAVKYDIKIDGTMLSYLIPPLAVQVLLENALKHNKAVKESPLCINIYNDGEQLYVTNNLQAKMRNYVSTGVGLDNLKKRYTLVADDQPEFSVTADKYTARLPLIKPE